MAGKVDETDKKLLMFIVTNPRISYQALSKKLGITKQAAHHRVQALEDSGVIGSMTADISVPYLGAVTVAVFGISNAPSIPEVFDRLGESEFTRRVIAGCGNYIYVNGILRDMSELDEFVGFVKRSARIRHAKICFYSPDEGLMPNYVVDGITNRKPGYGRLSRLDLRIIMSLKEDVRKPFVEIAKELRVTAKTVRRHLERMISKGWLELHVRTDQMIAGDLMFLVHVTLRDGADGAAVGRRLMSRYPFRDAFLVTYSSIPRLLMWVLYTDEITRVREIMSAVNEDEDIVAVMPNLGYMMRIYSTWQDKLPERLLQAANEARTVDRRSTPKSRPLV